MGFRGIGQLAGVANVSLRCHSGRCGTDTSEHSTLGATAERITNAEPPGDPMPDPTCPIHVDTTLRCQPTRYGHQWKCPRPGCSVVWWGRPRTTPADDKTRQARQRAHAAFDPLWQTKRMTRREAYAWMARYLRTDPYHAHIGMLDIQMCNYLIDGARSVMQMPEPTEKT